MNINLEQYKNFDINKKFSSSNSIRNGDSYNQYLNNNNNNNNSKSSTPIDFIRNPILKINTPSKAQSSIHSNSKSKSYNDSSYLHQQHKQKTVNIVTPLSSPAPSVISGPSSFRSNNNNSSILKNDLEKNLTFVVTVFKFQRVVVQKKNN
jgi:hypothetical protein